MKQKTVNKPRSRPLRVERDDVLLFITNRTIEERFWLHPILTCGAKPANRKARRHLVRFEKLCSKRYDKLARQANARNGPFAPQLTGKDILRFAKGLIGSALARAQKNRNVQIFAFVALSNHFHMVIRTPEKNASAFIRDFKSIVARSINRITGRRGPLWARRADIQPILDDTAACGRVAYCVNNPTKARLVKDPETWPGLNLAFGIVDTDEVPFEYFDTEAWHQAKRPRELNDFFTTVMLTLRPLPACDGMDRKRYAANIRSWLVHQISEESTPVREQSSSHTSTEVLGIETVLKAAYDQRPKHPNNSERPYCFGSRAHRKAHYEEMNDLIAVHEDCSQRFRAGNRAVRFPTGTYPPPILAAA